MIPDVKVIDHAHYHQPMDLSATVYRNPEAWILKGPVSHRFNARVCGVCGYTEFYVENPDKLLNLARQATSGS